MLVIADLYPCIKDHATHTKSRGLMSLPLIRSASRPLMRRAKGPSPMFTHSPPHALLQPLWKVQWLQFLFLSPSAFLAVSLFLSTGCGSALIIFTNSQCWRADDQWAQLLTSVDPSLTCIWLRPSSPRFTCWLSSWFWFFSNVIWSQPASAKPLFILHVEVSNEDVGLMLNAAPLLN